VLQTNLSFSSFDIFLKQLETNFRRTGATKVLLKAEPFLSRLKQFTGAIDSVTQTNEYATIVWGCIKGILEVAFTMIFFDLQVNVIDSRNAHLADCSNPLFHSKHHSRNASKFEREAATI
jgi:hypothetical protein